MKKIVIIGPESTGKSTLCEQLAQHYHSPWCPEYAREYLLTHGSSYTYDDLLHIAQGQLALEDKYMQLMQDKPGQNNNNDPAFLFIDTDMYVMKVWCEYVFGKCHRFILDQIAERKYDYYLLCNTDLPWVKDELREYPDPAVRRRLYLMYKDLMADQPVPFTEITGNYDNRLRKAIEAIDRL